MKDTERLLNKLDINEDKEKQIENFADILDNISSLENKKDIAYTNAGLARTIKRKRSQT